MADEVRLSADKRQPPVLGLAVLVAGYVFAGVTTAKGGPTSAALFTVTPLVALAALWGRRRLSLSMVGIAPVLVLVAAAWNAAPEPENLILKKAPAAAMLWLTLTAAAGYMLGNAVRLRMPFGIALMLSGGAAVLGVLLFVVVAWEAWLAYATYVFEFQEAALRANENMDATMRQARIELFELAFVSYWPDIGVGFTVAYTIVGFALMAAALRGIDRLRRRGKPVASGWLETRVPDWMAWAVVVAAGMATWHELVTPNEVLRAISWNALLALAGVYWVQGIGVGFYLMRAIGVHWSLWTVAGFVFVMFPHANATVSIVGFFDTWIDARARADRLKVLRDENESQEP